MDLRFKLMNNRNEKNMIAWYSNNNITIILDNLLERKNESFIKIGKKIHDIYLQEFICNFIYKTRLFKNSMCSWSKKSSAKIKNKCVMRRIVDEINNPNYVFKNYLSNNSLK